MSFEIQRADMWKRISAFILDAIIICIAATGAMYILSLATGYDSQAVKLEDYYDQYASDFGIEKFDITEDEYNSLTEEGKANYDEAYRALISDTEVLKTYSLVVNLTMLITSLGIFCAFALAEFAVPLIFGNGQTVGKKIFSLGVIRCDGVKINTFMLFVRTLLGKFTVETMIPVLLIVMLFFGSIGFVSLIVIGLILLLQIILLIATRNRTVIHDAFAQTAVVDLPSQMVFDTADELLAYKKKLAADNAARQDY